MQRFGILLFATLPAFAGTITSAELSGFGTTMISGAASAAYILSNFLSPPDPGSISATTEASASTLGPMRNGFIEVTGWGGAEDPGNATLSIGGYSFACGFSCASLSGTLLPFTLGIPFEVGVSASAGTLGQGTLTGSAAINFHFSLFESYVSAAGLTVPGASVVIYDPPVAVAEPTMFAPMCLALLGLVGHIAR